MDFVEVDIEIEDFNTSDLIDELESRGYLCIKAGGGGADPDAAIKSFDLERIEHLAICGQKTAARHELFEMVHVAIGCDLTH